MASVYYKAYLHGYLAGEVDNICSAPEGNGLLTPPEDEGINLDAWMDAQRWGYEDGYNGGSRKAEVSVEMFLDSNYSI